VSPAERLVVGRALAGAGLVGRARELIEAAADGAEHVDDRLGALRERALIRFTAGEQEEARADFRSAVELISGSGVFSGVDEVAERSRTRLAWARAEYAAGQKDEARARAEEAGDIPMAMWSDPEISAIRNELSKFVQIEMK
jgi:hypothetical protein